MTPREVDQFVADMADALGTTTDAVLAMDWSELQRQRQRLQKEAEAQHSALDDIDNEMTRRAAEWN